MRFAFKTSPQNTTWDEMLPIWQTADDIDVFESGWTFDHFYPIFSDSTGPCLEGWITLTALAQATKRLRVGVLVTGIHYRHPAVLANMAAALDVISHGRLELGIGAGWNEEECRGLGLPFPDMSERFERLEEALQIFIQMCSDDEGPYRGKHNTLERTLNSPQSVQRPHPPILIGGSGEKKTLRMVAQYGQACNLFAGPDVAHKLDVLREHCANLGTDYDAIEKTVISSLDPGADGRNVDALLEQLRSFAELGIQHVHGSVPGVADLTPLQILGEQVIPVAAGF